MVQLVRRASEVTASEYPKIDSPGIQREGILKKALLAVLSINVFVLSGVLSFCLFVYFYPQ